MATKRYKPTSAGMRNRRVSGFDEVTASKPEKSLVTTLNRFSGRNNTGKITVRHRCAGVKKQFRVIDFLRQKDNIPATVKSIEYDPYRTAYIALLFYADGHKSYILCPNKLSVGDTVVSGPDSEISVGNALPLENIPTGSIIHNVELTIYKGAQIGRSAGSYVTLMAKSGNHATVKLPSGELRLVPLKCRATIGQVSNSDRRNTRASKASDSIRRGRRPTVRGSVMNPCDHPHGGGEGRAPIGLAGPRTPWGNNPGRGYITRDKKKSNRLIVKSRKKK